MEVKNKRGKMWIVLTLFRTLNFTPDAMFLDFLIGLVLLFCYIFENGLSFTGSIHQHSEHKTS